MIYSVASTIAFLSEAMTLNPGDVLVMGTPPGVGFAPAQAVDEAGRSLRGRD
jgi:2-keto-4-pentenoate hydratase/2-oxohepta-3-ene-1,7-dioic acid hydratase in catechol pathway